MEQKYCIGTLQRQIKKNSTEIISKAIKNLSSKDRRKAPFFPQIYKKNFPKHIQKFYQSNNKKPI